METCSVKWVLYEGNPSVSGGFPSQRPVTGSFDMIYLRLNKRLSEQSRRRWFETPWHSLWLHCMECLVANNWVLSLEALCVWDWNRNLCFSRKSKLDHIKSYGLYCPDMLNVMTRANIVVVTSYLFVMCHVCRCVDGNSVLRLKYIIKLDSLKCLTRHSTWKWWMAYCQQ